MSKNSIFQKIKGSGSQLENTRLLKILAFGPPVRRKQRVSLLHPATTITAICAVLSLLSVIAAVNDVRAFYAVAQPKTFISLVMLVTVLTIIFAIKKDSKIQQVPIFLVLAILVCTFLASSNIPQLWAIAWSAPVPVVPQPAGAAINLRGDTVPNAVYSGTSLKSAQLANSNFVDSSFAGSDLSEADLRDATFKNVNFAGVDLCGADIRGADLRGAVNLNRVTNWNYVFYDSKTKTPKDINLKTMGGPEYDTGRGLLYMCTPGDTAELEPNGKRF